MGGADDILQDLHGYIPPSQLDSVSARLKTGTHLLAQHGERRCRKREAVIAFGIHHFRQCLQSRGDLGRARRLASFEYIYHLSEVFGLWTGVSGTSSAYGLPQAGYGPSRIGGALRQIQPPLIVQALEAQRMSTCLGSALDRCG